MASKTRIYEVQVVGFTLPDGEEVAARTFLIEAASQAEAHKHVRDKYVRVPFIPNGRRIADLVASGVKVETAT